MIRKLIAILRGKDARTAAQQLQDMHDRMQRDAFIAAVQKPKPDTPA